VLRKFNDRTITCPSRGLLGVGVFLLALVTFGLPAALAADALRHGTLWRDRSQRLRRLSAGNRRWLHRHRQWRPRLWLGRECAWKIKSVKKTGKNDYAVVASCQCLDGPKETRHRKLSERQGNRLERKQICQVPAPSVRTGPWTRFRPRA